MMLGKRMQRESGRAGTCVSFLSVKKGHPFTFVLMLVWQIPNLRSASSAGERDATFLHMFSEDPQRRGSRSSSFDRPELCQQGRDMSSSCSCRNCLKNHAHDINLAAQECDLAHGGDVGDLV